MHSSTRAWLVRKLQFAIINIYQILEISC